LPIKNLKNKFDKLSLIEKFFSISIFTFLSWSLLYNFILLDSAFDLLLIKYAVNSSSIVLDIFNFRTEVLFNEISIIGEKGVLINSGCNILKVFGLYVSFVFGYPNQIIKKLIYSFIGFSLLFLMNIFRISIFALVTAYIPEFWPIIHKYSTFIIFYPLILGLWLSLIKKS
tara:strand:+ start:1092 stop:1604 length:513 start_codon:yes stop_codon:yes gene_type:complete